MYQRGVTYLVLGKPWALYIKHQEYIYYIYILTQCHDTLCPETLVDQTMLPLSPEGGSLFSLTLKFLQKIQITSLLASFQKHAAKIDSDLTRTIRPPFFNWRIGEIVLGQAAVLSPISRSSPRILPIARQPMALSLRPGLQGVYPLTG